MLAYTIDSSGGVNLVVNGKNHSILAGDKNYDSVLEVLNGESEDKASLLEGLLNVVDTVQSYLTGSGISIQGGSVYWNGMRIENVVVDRILDFSSKKLPYMPLVKFLEKLMQNPSHRSVNLLYNFLEHGNMPICEDGDFLAYKAVTNDYLDKHTKKISNKVGDKPSIPRFMVNDDPEVACSVGLHAGSLKYASDFMGCDGRLIIVKINPANCVCVPKDVESQKLRTCEYEVVAEYTGPLEFPLANKDASEYDASGDWSCCYEDYGDDEDEDEDEDWN